MQYLTGQGIINDALSLIRNNSSPVRTKMLTWLNVIAQKLAVVRPWEFLNNGSASLTPGNNIITLPADYGEFQSLRAGSSFFLTPKNRLTAGEAWRLDNASTGLSVPRGFTEGTVDVTAGNPPVTTTTPILTLHGGTYTESVTLTYTKEPPAIADSVVATCWPKKCQPLMMRALLDFFYEYDMDERAALSYQLNAAELSELKKWDNGQKPKTQRDRRGLRGTR